MKATHSGTCQACGSLQKLPKGRLSLHGYTVLGGFFSGICRGARHEPFEVSCDLVAQFVREAQDELKRVEGQQRHLRRPATEAKAMIHHYVGSQRGRSSYEWIERNLRVETDAEGRHKYFYTARRAGGKWTAEGWEQAEKQIQDYEYGRETVSEFCTKLNKVYADWLQHQVDSLKRYIAWQQERVRTWKPADLLPVDAKAAKGAAFEPTEAKY